MALQLLTDNIIILFWASEAILSQACFEQAIHPEINTNRISCYPNTLHVSQTMSFTLYFGTSFWKQWSASRLWTDGSMPRTPLRYSSSNNKGNCSWVTKMYCTDSEFVTQLSWMHICAHLCTRNCLKGAAPVFVGTHSTIFQSCLFRGNRGMRGHGWSTRTFSKP